MGARFGGGESAANLRNHAARDGAAGDELVDARGVEFGDKGLGRIKHAGNIGEKHNAGRVHDARDRAGRFVGVHIERFALGGEADRVDDRHEARGQEGVSDGGVTADDLANFAGVEGKLRGVSAFAKAAIGQAEADDLRALRREQAEQPHMGASREHADNLIDRLARGDADTVDARRFDAEARELLVDLRAAAVDKNDATAALIAVRAVKGNEASERLSAELRVLEQRSADLDDERCVLQRMRSVLQSSPPTAALGAWTQVRNPAVSSKPKRRFMQCTAWPAAPLTRLSMLGQRPDLRTRTNGRPA